MIQAELTTRATHGLRVLAFASLVLSAAPADAQTARVRGTVVSADKDNVVVQVAGASPLTVHLAPAVTVGRRVRADMGTIKPQDYVGVTAIPAGPSSLKAVEVFIFPPAMRGTGEGHRPMDLLPESTMTNATLAETVDTVDGKAMHLTYKGGEKSIVLTPDTRVFTFAQGTTDDLKPGRQVAFTAEQKPDGPVTARITVDDPSSPEQLQVGCERSASLQARLSCKCRAGLKARGPGSGVDCSFPAATVLSTSMIAAMTARRQPSSYSSNSMYSFTVWTSRCPAPMVTVGMPRLSSQFASRPPAEKIRFGVMPSAFMAFTARVTAGNPLRAGR